MSNSDPVRETFSLVIERPNEDVAIEICDAYDRVVAAPLAMHPKVDDKVQDTSLGHQIKIMLPPGLYTVRGRLGGELKEQVVRLNGETNIAAPAPTRSTSAAYQGVESSHEYYSYPAVDCSKQPTTDALAADAAADASLFIFLRARDKKAYGDSGGGLETAASQLHLETPKGQVISLAAHSKIHPDGWLAFSSSASKGDYRLHDLGDEPRTTPIALYSSWQTQMFLTFDRRPLHNTLRLFFSRRERGFLLNDDWARATDLGLSVLASGRGALPAEARRIMLGDKFENPMLGLIAAWLALREVDSPLVLSQDVVSNLDYLLPDSPDVAVLRVAHARRYGHGFPMQPISRIPLLRIAAGELIRFAAEYREILPDDSMLNDISPRLYADCAFTSWRSIDRELPASLRLARSALRLGSQPGTSLLDGVISYAKSPSAEIESAEQSQERVPAEEDPGVWLQEAVADVIEQHAQRHREQSAASALEVAQMAQRTGVTPKAVLQVLQSTPLENKQIALSLSDTPSEEGLHEDTANHVIDATVYLARTLIAAGASLAYGGDFRNNGFTPLLSELIKTYNQTATRPAQSLHGYLGAPIPLGDIPEGLPLVVHHLVYSPDVACDALMPPPSEAASHPRALYFSDMRRVMAKHASARIVLGGQSEPRAKDKGPGYGGRYPGVVEEAWRTLEAGKPLYVVGGFGGAAALVADLIEGKEIPPRLQDRTWESSKYFRDKAEAIDLNPYRTKLGLPRSMEDLAQVLLDIAAPLLASDANSMQWNGLTIDENQHLFRTRDTATLTSLVIKGLLRKLTEHNGDDT